MAGSVITGIAHVAVGVSISLLVMSCVKLANHDPAARAAECHARHVTPPDWFRSWCETNRGCELTAVVPGATEPAWPSPAAVVITAFVGSAGFLVMIDHAYNSIGDVHLAGAVAAAMLHVLIAVALGILPGEPCAYGPWLTAAAVGGFIWCAGAAGAYGVINADFNAARDAARDAARTA